MAAITENSKDGSIRQCPALSTQPIQLISALTNNIAAYRGLQKVQVEVEVGK